MAFEVFKERVNALINRAGGDIDVMFSTDTEKGKHLAKCSDGTTIIGSARNLNVTVNWGSGHQAMATI